jgi:hypothetical protein
MSDIFISYASDDLPRVEPLAKALEEQGWSIFWDRTIPVGKSWRVVIQSELEAAKCVVVIWTENSINSKWVLAEVNEAYEKDILTQVLFNNITIPFPYKQEQAADLIDWKAESTHSGFTILLSAISEVVGLSPLKIKKTEQIREEEDCKREQEEEREPKEVKAEMKADKPKPFKVKTHEPSPAPKVTQKDDGNNHSTTAQTNKKPEMLIIPQKKQISTERRIGLTLALAIIGGVVSTLLIAMALSNSGMPLWVCESKVSGISDLTDFNLFVGIPMIVNNLIVIVTASALTWVFIWRNYISAATMLLASGIVGVLAICVAVFFDVKGSRAIAGTVYVVFYNILVSGGLGLLLAIACEVLKRKSRM